jgi:hypothetical protein
MWRRTTRIVALGLLTAACGGNSHLSSPQSPSTQLNGEATLKVIWPVRTTRLIPNATNSLVVTLSQNGKAVATQTIARPASGASSTSTSFTDLPYGNLQVSINAYPSSNGTGVAQATGAGVLAVSPGVSAAVTVSLASTVSNLTLAPSMNSITAGQTESIVATAYDSSGNIVLLSAGGGTDVLSWSSDTPNVATLTGVGPTATLNAIANGIVGLTASIKTTDSGGSVSGSCRVAVGSSLYKLASGGFPKSHGDAGDTGRSSVSKGAAGTMAWQTSLGSNAITALIVGPDETVYAGTKGSVSALNSNGTILWTQPVSGAVTGLLLTAGGQILVGGDVLSVLDSTNKGNLLWTFATDNPCFEPNVSSDGLTIFQTTKTSCYAINPFTRNVIWRKSYSLSGGAVLAGDGSVAVWGPNNVYLLNPSSGSLLSNRQIPVLQAVCADDQAIYYENAIVTTQTTPYGDYSTAAPAFGSISSTGASWNLNSSASIASVSPLSVSPAETLVFSFATARAGMVGGIPRGGSKFVNILSKFAPSGSSFNAAGTGYLEGAYRSQTPQLVSFNAESQSIAWSLNLSKLSATPAIGPSGAVYCGDSSGKVTKVK